MKFLMKQLILVHNIMVMINIDLLIDIFVLLCELSLQLSWLGLWYVSLWHIFIFHKNALNVWDTRVFFIAVHLDFYFWCVMIIWISLRNINNLFCFFSGLPNWFKYINLNTFLGEEQLLILFLWGLLIWISS